MLKMAKRYFGKKVNILECHAYPGKYSFEIMHM